MTPRVRQRLLTLAYLLAALLVVLPLTDLVTNIWPWNVRNVSWRYGSYTLLSGFLLTPIMGVSLALGAAVAADQRRTARILGVLSLAAGIILGGVTLLFVLDAVQIRAAVPPEASSQFMIGAAKALVKVLLMAAAGAWMGVIGWRSGSRSRARAVEGETRVEPGMLGRMV